MIYSRFDIVEAHYWFCVDYHNGKSSILYERLCRISEYFSPSILSREPSSDNAQDIYNTLVANHGTGFSSIAL